MKQFRVLSLLTIFSLLAVGCFGISMLVYQQAYPNAYGANASAQRNSTPDQQREYTAQMNAIYLRNQFI